MRHGISRWKEGIRSMETHKLSLRLINSLAEEVDRGDTRAALALVGALRDPAGEVREAARNTLTRKTHPAFVQTLAGLLRSASPWDCNSVVRILVALGEPAIKPLLLALCERVVQAGNSTETVYTITRPALPLIAKAAEGDDINFRAPASLILDRLGISGRGRMVLARKEIKASGPIMFVDIDQSPVPRKRTVDRTSPQKKRKALLRPSTPEIAEPIAHKESARPEVVAVGYGFCRRADGKFRDALRWWLEVRYGDHEPNAWQLDGCDS